MKKLDLFILALLLFVVNAFAAANNSSSIVTVPQIYHIENYTDLETAIAIFGATETTLMINSAQILTDGSPVPCACIIYKRLYWV